MTHGNVWYSSAFTGIFTRFGATPVRPHDPAFAVASGEASSWLAHRETSTASGIGLEPSAAESACIGEAIERLQAGPLPTDRLVTASYREWPLGERAVDPRRWVLFHPDQYALPDFPFQPMTADTVCDWVCFREASTGEPWWIPADLAYLHLPGGHRFCPGYSTGLACGRTGDAILLRGLQEMIERDAVVGAWWGRYPLDEHDAANVFAELAPEIAERCQRPNLCYRFYRAASPFSNHVTLVTLEGEDREGYVFSIGSACRQTQAASWEKSLLEAIHGRHYVRYLKSQQHNNEHMPSSFAEHALYYSMHPEQLRATKLAGATRAPDDHAATAIEDVALLTTRLGPARPVLCRSITPPALVSEGLDWHVLRVVVPGLQPLHGHHALPHLGGPLWAPRGLADWRAMPPHPFP
jgi:ribosomal protein S12 methylthiotransferase accessory factor